MSCARSGLSKACVGVRHAVLSEHPEGDRSRASTYQMFIESYALQVKGGVSHEGEAKAVATPLSYSGIPLTGVGSRQLICLHHRDIPFKYEPSISIDTEPTASADSLALETACRASENCLKAAVSVPMLQGSHMSNITGLLQVFGVVAIAVLCLAVAGAERRLLQGKPSTFGISRNAVCSYCPCHALSRAHAVCHLYAAHEPL